MRGYTVSINKCSTELTPREKIKVKDLSNAVKLDTAADASPVEITPSFYVILDIHNEKSENPDYTNLLIVDVDGNKYVTGSPSFMDSFFDIWDEMKEADANEVFSIECYKLDSKNYKGKKFLTCSII